MQYLAPVVVALALAAPGSAERVRERADRPASDPVLWRDPGSIAQKDLFWGAGHPERAPRPPFTFVKEDTGGTKPKVIVADANGTTWSVKFSGRSASSNEVHAEIAATRLAWAFGYLVEEHYYVADGVIDNAHGLRRAADSIGKAGRFRVARFERRSMEVARTGRHWSLVDNPFADTQELSGLKLVLALVNNWDTKSRNLSVFQVRRPNGQIQDLYLVSDYGSSFGRMAPFALFSSRNRWSLRDFQNAPFIEGVDDRSLTVNHKGDVTISTVPIDHARWFARLASPLTSEQVRRAFEASGASRAEVDGFSARVMEKLQELRDAAGIAASW